MTVTENKHPLPDAALDGDIIILAKKGAGKTVTGKNLVEDLLSQGEQVIAIDPLSVWWGLKSSRDGKSDGFPVAIFGGPRGDVPLNLDASVPLAKTLVKNNLSAVLDLSEWVEEEQCAFLSGFLSEVYQTNKKPIWLVLEEAHEFAPQTANSSQQHACLAMIRRIAKGGRSKGIRLVAITQRNAELHKSIVSGASTIIAMKTTATLDQTPILKWFQGNADKDFALTVKNGLGKLKRGEAFVGASDQDFFERVKFPLNGTFDSSSTPKRGEVRDEPTTLAKIDLTAIKEALKPKEDDAPVVTPENKDAVALLQNQLKTEYERGKGDAEIASQDEIRVHQSIAFQKGRQFGHKEAIESLTVMADDPQPYSPYEIDDPDALRSVAVERIIEPIASPPKVSDVRLNNIPVKKPSPVQASGKKNAIVLAAERVYPAKLTWAALCATDGRKSRGGHFNGLKKRALDSGLIRDEGGLVVLTYNPLPPGTENRPAADLLEEKLPQPSRKMFSAIRQHPGHSWDAIAEHLGVKAHGGHWNGGRAVLRNSGLVIEDGDTVRISPDLE